MNLTEVLTKEFDRAALSDEGEPVNLRTAVAAVVEAAGIEATGMDATAVIDLIVEYAWDIVSANVSDTAYDVAYDVAVDAIEDRFADEAGDWLRYRGGEEQIAEIAQEAVADSAFEEAESLRGQIDNLSDRLGALNDAVGALAMSERALNDEGIMAAITHLNARINNLSDHPKETP